MLLSARRRHIPVINGTAFNTLAPELSAVYRYMVRRARRRMIAAAIGRLCAPGALPGLVHCSAGKDRTGMLVALILAAIGVEDDVIAADYALSRTYLLAEPTAAVRQVRASTGLGQRLDLQLMGSPPEIILGRPGPRPRPGRQRYQDTCSATASPKPSWTRSGRRSSSRGRRCGRPAPGVSSPAWEMSKTFPVQVVFKRDRRGVSVAHAVLVG